MPHTLEGRRYVCTAAVACLATLSLSATAARAASLPTGFTETLIAQGLTNPTAMNFAPDGRLFVCQQGGALRVIENGVLLPTPFVTISVNASGERGLLGVAFHPNFLTSDPYVYVYYTTSTAPIHNRVSRFTANGNVAVPGSEVVIVDLDNLSSATNHNGGAIDFGADGKLYIAVGDNANGNNAKSLSNRLGKMLRLEPDGSIPSDNPATFPGISGSTSGANRAIWAVGLRNPFTFALDPGGSPAVLINDVGEASREEINVGDGGLNFGWPDTEGDFDPNAFPAFTRPRYAYSSAANPECAITGGTFYSSVVGRLRSSVVPGSPTFPPEYHGTYFFADFCAGWIKRIDPTHVLTYPGMTTPIDFASGISNPVDLKVGPDTNLYYLARGNGRVYRVQYTGGAPAASDPQNVTVAAGQNATFAVEASGDGPLSFQWQRNNVDIPGATSSSYTLIDAHPADDGAAFRVNVSNAAGNVFSRAGILTVTAAPLPTPGPRTSLKAAGRRRR
jgi:glucose/arabinose dehydrogenase